MDLTELDGFLDWHEIEQVLHHDSWLRITAVRLDAPTVTLLAGPRGRLSIAEAQLSVAQRAELCRWGFAPMSTAAGRCWAWAPTSSDRVHRRPTGPLLWAVALQRDRKAIRVLRELLRAEPDLITVVVREERELAV